MLPTPSTFEVTKRSSRPTRSLAGVTGLNAARGIAFIEDPANPGCAKLADGTLPIAGFITRNAQVGGPTIADAILPNRLELPFADTDFQSFELAEEVQCEGYGAIAALAGGAATGGQVLTNGVPMAGGAVQTGTVQWGAFLYSGSGANAAKTITGATAIGTKVSYVGGQFCVAQTGQYAEWYLAQILAPWRPDLNTFRVRLVLIAGDQQ
jgi:hypothetical protein